ncbi:SAP domain-containing protein [Actinoplanes sp. NPDC048791]|uniref:SAP domain-containing protein n=1 Tax=Actinoplanes sp. NPDC048791 TaxID=3154623 RepID=UPI0033D0D5DA
MSQEKGWNSVAATKSAKNPTAHNDTPNTPEVRESAIAKMKVAELRQKLRTHGVKDTAELKKPELVKKLIKAEVSATKTKSTKKNPTSGNDTPNTPDVSESAIAAMKVDGLRRKLRGHGVKDTAELKKPELVKKLIKAEVAATKKSTSTKKTSSAKKSTTKSKNPTSGNDTPNTPDVSESAIAAMKVDDLRRRLRGHGVKGTGELKKPELVQRLIKVETAGARKKASKK